jgi:hypothetical protein
MPALKVNTPQVQALIVLLYWDSMQKKNLINANISVNEQSEWFRIFFQYKIKCDILTNKS